MITLSHLQIYRKLRSKEVPLSDYESSYKTLVLDHNIEDSVENLKKFKFFSCKLQQRWQDCNRTEEKFLNKYGEWLKKEVTFKLVAETFKDPEDAEAGPSSSTGARKSFSELSDRQKRRVTEPIRNNFSAEQVMFANKTMMNVSNNSDCAKVMSILSENPARAKEVLKFCQGEVEPPKIAYTKEKGLAIYISSGLSKASYNNLRELSSSNLYPSYYAIQQAKKDCYPPKEAIKITETLVSVNLQSLLDLTTRRIFEIPGVRAKLGELTDLALISKWGMDASTQSNFKLKFNEIEENIARPQDSSVFSTYLVPLRLSSGLICIWENPRPSSTFFCRPVRFEFLKENEEAIKSEYERMEDEISHLAVTEADNCKVKHELICSMIDGKVCNAIANNKSTQRCYICGAIGKELNDLNRKYKKPQDDKLYQLGLSTLHARIRTMEFLFKLACKNATTRFSTLEEHPEEEENANNRKKKLTEEEKAAKIRKKKELDERYQAEFANKKKEMQENFRKELGILVDFVKQGHGSTNDGNTARKFFEKPEVTARITGLDEDLIRRFKIILEVITCGEEVDAEKYDLYAKKTAQTFVNLYGWCNLSPTVHKLLLHGAEIIQRALLPIGKLSEEALEATHKIFRKFRKEKSRKMNRLVSNQDVLNNLLINSDPLISSMRYNLSSVKRKKKPLDAEAVSLLVQENQDDSGLGEMANECDESTESEGDDEDEDSDV